MEYVGCEVNFRMADTKLTFMLLSSTRREEMFLMDMHKIYIDYNLQTASILFDYNFKGHLNSLIVNFSCHCETPV